MRLGGQIQEGVLGYEKYVAFMEWASQCDEGDLNIRSLLWHNDWLNQ